MLASALIAIAVQVAPIPPALPQDPGPERRAAAAALFPREAYISEYSHGMAMAASRLSAEILNERGANAYDRDFRLSDRLIARAKSAPETIIDQAIQCVAEPIAQRLYVPDLVALKAFAASPEGRNFWSYFLYNQPWVACFDRPVREYLAPFVEQDLAVVMAEKPGRARR
ncbi:hypothetical protein [Caulobacter hibisci]|uniref:DUF2059 domain-containing protein n=1 Tax=Caulobacter hibisci TaxID=2035993 RepID=A0ABS0SW78_9CAUL|nr:hypothetical protein [Caulobacter hibisci]MBI1683900.1 hypothetical protein [Caulobacter hibisci]